MEQKADFIGMHSGMTVKPAQGVTESARAGNITVHGFWFRIGLDLILGILRSFLESLKEVNSRAWAGIKSKGRKHVRHG